MSQVSIEVPENLNNLSVVLQAFVGSIRDGKGWAPALGEALPVLFSEGAHWDDLKAEIKDPRAVVLAGLFLGEVVALLLAKKAAALAEGKKEPAQVAAPAQA